MRPASEHAISNPTLAGIEKRWEEMPPQEQADLWMALRDRMKNDWHELTLQERKAGTYNFHRYSQMPQYRRLNGPCPYVTNIEHSPLELQQSTPPPKVCRS